MNVKIMGPDSADNAGALTAARQVCTARAHLFSVTFYNTGPDQYLQIFDSASAVANGTVPKIQLKILADSHGSVDFVTSRIFTAGIYICNSTTSATRTVGSANLLLDTTYRLI